MDNAETDHELNSESGDDGADIDIRGDDAPDLRAPPEDGTDSSEQASNSYDDIPHPQRTTVLAVVLALLLAAAIAGDTWLLTRGVAMNGVEQDRADAVQAARQVVINLVTLDHTDPRETVERVLAGSTGAFRQQFSSQASVMQKILREAKVTSSGEIAEAGLARMDGEHAVVLVAVSATVKNAQIRQGEPRQYRMSVNLEKKPDSPAGWLVSGVEFVP